jgi:two-component system response regulator FixJ
MESPEPVVFVVEDDSATRRTLELILHSNGFHATAFPSAENFLMRIARVPPGCWVVDLHLPGIGGLDLVAQYSERREIVTPIIVTGHGTFIDAVRSMRVGAVDFLTKPIDPPTLVRAVERAIRVDSQKRSAYSNATMVRERYQRLSPRERQVLDLVVSGDTNKQIAEKLGLRAKTVEVHRLNLKRKVGATSTGDLVKFAASIRCGGEDDGLTGTRTAT